jgi:hypothetical protein
MTHFRLAALSKVSGQNLHFLKLTGPLPELATLSFKDRRRPGPGPFCFFSLVLLPPPPPPREILK